MFDDARRMLKLSEICFDKGDNIEADQFMRECWDRLRVDLERENSISSDDIYVFDTMINSTKKSTGHERVIETLNVIAFFENMLSRRKSMKKIKDIANS